MCSMCALFLYATTCVIAVTWEYADYMNLINQLSLLNLNGIYHLNGCQCRQIQWKFPHALLYFHQDWGYYILMLWIDTDRPFRFIERFAQHFASMRNVYICGTRFRSAQLRQSFQMIDSALTYNIMNSNKIWNFHLKIPCPVASLFPTPTLAAWNKTHHFRLIYVSTCTLAIHLSPSKFSGKELWRSIVKCSYSIWLEHLLPAADCHFHLLNSIGNVNIHWKIH